MQEFIKKYKKPLQMLALILFVFVLASCAKNPQPQAPITADSTGFWDRMIIYNLSQFLIKLSEICGHDYGLGIIAFTLITQTLLIPFTIYQQKNADKSMALQPKIKELQHTYSAQDAATKEKLQSEIKRVQDEAGVSMSSQFLPLFIQMPIFIALYQAVVRTPELATGDFLWLQLGQPDPYMIIPIIAALSLLLNAYLMQIGRENPGGSFMIYFMPVLIFFITFRLSSSLSLYFATRNIYTVVTTLVFDNPFKKIEKRQAKEEAEKEEARRRRQAIRKAKKTGRSVKK
ncbi:membrane protein insertase YidC [Allofustis seminis]|uniref:membrane protein insertase YidC n=1 Tax=Allofustis seminis TaxID=166939 RepID=UPI0003605D32|nr:membrane protein insertase YidC [Allofustis seminis]